MSWPWPPTSATRGGVADRRRRERSRRSAASTCWSTTSAWRAAADLVDTSDEDWQEAFDQTLFPAIRASRLAVPHMQRRGGGAIVIIASIFGREAGGRMTYNAVKAAEISLAKSLAQQLAPSNIRVNSVSPGSILFEGGSWWKRQQDESCRHCRVRAGASCPSAASAPRGSWRRRGVPRLAARELDQRHIGRRRRVPEPGLLSARLRRSAATAWQALAPPPPLRGSAWQALAPSPLAPSHLRTLAPSPRTLLLASTPPVDGIALIFARRVYAVVVHPGAIDRLLRRRT